MPTKLAYVDRFRRVLGTPIESDTSNSIAFSIMPSEPTEYKVMWTGEQFKKLLSSVIAGADLIWGDESDEIIWQLIKAVHETPIVDPNDSGCVEYAPSAPFIKYFPDNPYILGDRALGWEKEAWYKWGDFDSIFPDWLDEWLAGYAGDLLGYQNSDVLFNISSLVPDFGAPVGDLIEIIEAGGVELPRIEIRFSGSGTVELGLLSFPLGGKCIIELDEMPNVIDILTGGVADAGSFMVELNRDLVSFPPDEYPIINIEIPVTTNGNHTLYIVFLPVLNDEIPFLHFGGGLRSVELCGFEDTPMSSIEGLIFEDCTLKVLIAGEYEPVTNFSQLYECIEGLMATQQEIKQAIIDAQLELISRTLSGETQNLKSGLIINPDFTKELKLIEAVDDPETPYVNEEQAAKCGGVIAVEKGINELLDYAYNTYGTDSTSDVGLEDFKYLMSTKYDVDTALMDAAVETYSGRRFGSLETINSVSALGLQNKLFSKGNLKSVVVNYILSLTGNSLAARQACIEFVQAINQSQLELWYELGTKIPSTNYLDYPSTPIQSETITLEKNEVKTTIGIWKQYHRFRITVSGSFVDGDGNRQDAYYFSEVGEATVYNQYAFNVDSFGSFPDPTSSVVPYNSGHVYQWTVDKTSPTNTGQVTCALHGDMDAPSTTGLLTVLVEDLGEYSNG